MRHSRVDNILWNAHKALTGSEHVRAMAGAGAHTRDAPQARLHVWSVSRWGLFCHNGQLAGGRGTGRM